MQKTVGEVLIDLLESFGVDTVFGIPGVHTVELYRGLANSNIRHITPRHELSAGFMADGYARVSGKPGVCLLITGPGLTNAITAMAQARADSIPMLVISGVNKVASHGKEEGLLHELPDQSGMMKTIALSTHTLQCGNDIGPVVEKAFIDMKSARPGPVHIEIPLDVMSQIIDEPTLSSIEPKSCAPDLDILKDAVVRCRVAKQPVIILGGGAQNAEEQARGLAEKLNACVITTVNARGLLAGHELEVPASPSLKPVRDKLAEADLVIAVGTQFGPTDYDMYVDGGFPKLKQLIRIDIDSAQTDRGVKADLVIVGDAAAVLSEITTGLGDHLCGAGGALWAKQTRVLAMESLEPNYREYIALLDVIGKTLPGCIMVGDSTQLVYAGNLYSSITRKGGWFNAATGYGALGYGAPAAIGANLAEPSSPVVCITGDGGFQFSLAELGTAVDEKAPVIFLVWNNKGYQEIETYMVAHEIEPIGVRPSPPDFVKLADAYGVKGESISDTNLLAEGLLADALLRAHASKQPYLIEILTEN